MKDCWSFSLFAFSHVFLLFPCWNLPFLSTAFCVYIEGWLKCLRAPLAVEDTKKRGVFWGQITHGWQRVDWPPACSLVFSLWRSELQHSWLHVVPQLPLWASAAGPHSPGRPPPPESRQTCRIWPWHIHTVQYIQLCTTAFRIHECQFPTSC